MRYVACQYIGESDRESVLEFRRICTTEDNVGDYPSLTDLYELLNPLRSEQQKRIRLWKDQVGLVVAYANVAPSGYFSFLIHPDWRNSPIMEEILAYAEDTIHHLRQESGKELTLDIHCRDTDESKLQRLLRAGFEHDAEDVPVLVRLLADSVPEPRLPPGFRLRHVLGEHEVEQCVDLHRAAFGTQNMTVEIRRSIMQEPDYDPKGDLVIEAPDGTLVAYCICSIHPEENAQRKRAWGYTDPIGVRPAFQGQKLGKAILLSGLRYLRERGMEAASLTTSSNNIAMLRLSASVGFREHCRYLGLTRTAR